MSTNGIFTHDHVFTGYGGDIPYLYYKPNGGVIDGCGRQHINLYGRCNICNKEVIVARTHVDENGTLYDIKPELTNNKTTTNGSGI